MDHFYYEVEVLEGSESRVLGIGFCGEYGGRSKMPGLFGGSWGYHGDDGFLFMNGEDTDPSKDFGAAGQFSAGDTVGIYLNLRSGEGFCTRNGKKLDMG